MKALVTFSLLFVLFSARAEQEVGFHPGDEQLKVYHGQRVRIYTDSAYVLSVERVELLQHKLAELKAARMANGQLVKIHREVLDKVREIERLTAQLLEKLRKDHQAIELDLQLLIAELDESIAILKQTNAELSSNNEELKYQLSEMEQTVKHLRKEIRRIWWRGVEEKFLFGGVGVLVGFGLGAF